MSLKNTHLRDAIIASHYPKGRLETAEQIAQAHSAEMAEAARTLPAEVRLADGRVLTQAMPVALGYGYRALDGMVVVASYDATPHGLLLHVSVSYRVRDPRWKDIRLVRDAFFPPDVDVIQVLPRAGEYVNVHRHAFHLFQAPGEWQGGWNV